MMRTVTARLVKYAADVKTYSLRRLVEWHGTERCVTDHLFLIPITAYIAPDIMNIIPTMPRAGVIFGWIGRLSGVVVPVASKRQSCQSDGTC